MFQHRPVLRALCRFAGLLALVLMTVPATVLAQTGNPTHDALLARSDLNRRQDLQQAVRSRGDPCNSVTVAFNAGLDAQRNAFWDFRCADGNTYRARLAAERFAPVTFLRCGAAAPVRHFSITCFQPVTGATTQVAARSGGNAASCRAACANQPAAVQNQCRQRCLSGQGIQASAPVAGSLPPRSRFGAIFITDQPAAGFGFSNGNPDRLGANNTALRQCQSLARQLPCKFQGELVNQCGAIAMALSRSPNALVMTADISTQVLNLSTIGRGATREAAAAAALQSCRRAESAAIRCRIVAQGC